MTRQIPFHHHTEVVGRASEKLPGGRSVVASASYRSGKPLADERHERVWSYRKPEVVYDSIMLPTGAPAWASDRELLWNAVERSEKRKDAQLAREVEFSIPLEVPSSEWPAWCKQHMQAYVDMGMTVDLAIHDKPGNPHCHSLCTMREWDGERLAAKKNRGWNDQGLVDFHRARYERQVNDWMKAHGIDAFTDRRSYADQGIDQEPQIHVGATASALHEKHEADPEKHPEESWRWLANHAIQERNSERRNLKTAIAAIQEKIHAVLAAPPFRVSRRPPISGPLSPRASTVVANAAGRAATPGMHRGGPKGRSTGRDSFSRRDPAGEPLRVHARSLAADRGGHAGRDLVPVVGGTGSIGDGLVPVREAALHAPGTEGAVLPTGAAPQRNSGPARGIARQAPPGRPALVHRGGERPGHPQLPGAGAHLSQRPTGAGAAARLAPGLANLADLHAGPGGQTTAHPGSDRRGDSPTGRGGPAAHQAGGGIVEHQRRGPGDLAGGSEAGAPLDGGVDAPLGDGLVGMDANTERELMGLFDAWDERKAAKEKKVAPTPVELPKAAPPKSDPVANKKTINKQR